MKLGQMLRAHREDRKLGLREVARRIKCSPGYLSKIETDKEIPSEAKLTRLAGLLGIEPVILLAIAGRLPSSATKAIQNNPHRFLKLLDEFMFKDTECDELPKFGI